MIVWIGPWKFSVVAAPIAGMSPCFRAFKNALEDAMGLLAGAPFRFAAQQVFFGHHFQDRADVLGHAAVDEHQRVLELLAGGGGHLGVIQNSVGGHQPSAADAKLGIAFRGAAPRR